MTKEDWLPRFKGVLKKSLDALDMTPPAIESDLNFSKLCYNAAVERGYVVDGWLSPIPYLGVGVAMGQTAYAHLEKLETRVFIALFSAFTAALDDTYADVPGEVMSKFIVRMTSGQQQPYPNLEHFAAHMREASLHLDAVRTGIFFTSTFNWISTLDVDAAMLDKKIPPPSVRFPTWCGLMSGICEAFGVALFPPEVPVHVIAPVIPDMMVVIRNYNDIFSFYKEELLGDAANQITLLAQTQNSPKLDILDAITGDAIITHKRICAALSGNVAAHRAWLAFMKGYVGFHYATKRYRLGEVEIDTD